MIQDFPAKAKKVADIPGDFQPKPIGARKALIKNIEQVFPDVDFSNPAWGRLDGPDFSIEFNIGEEEMCGGLMLHVRGGGGAMAAINRLLKHLQMRAIDCQTGEFFVMEAADKSFARWGKYRDKVVSSAEGRRGSGKKPKRN